MLVLAAGPLTASEPLHVLLANDDGIDAPGLTAMAAVLAADPGYRVTVVAPKHQQSVTGHGLVTRRDVEVRKHAPIAGSIAWEVDGTPATVARIALTALLAQDTPDIVVSGINRGENDGLGAWTSGTVAVAREAALLGIPAVAVSLQLNWEAPDPDFAAAARWAKPVIDAVAQEGLPSGVYLNLNIPKNPAAARGYRVVAMALDRSHESRYVLVREDEEGTRWYDSRWSPPQVTEPGGDSHALAAGWVTIAPLGLDQTAERAFPLLQQLELSRPSAGEEVSP
ncbi:MAG: 5'/3'-nucleotidase SurE [Thermoanaerobaculales bacterium]